MKNRKYATIIGIIAIIGLTAVSKIMTESIPLRLFIDFPSFIFVTVGGCVLAFMKKPQNKNSFLKALSKTSFLCGAIGSVLGIISALNNVHGFVNSCSKNSKA